MTDDELTGTLQARGNNTVTIDGQEFNVPDYVVDWMKNMQRPLQDGETVLYKKSQSKEGGAWYLTKIRRPPKSNPNAGPQVDQKSGVLISHFNTGCTVRMANGDKNYALTKPFPKDVELPQKMEFSIDKQGFILGYKFWGKADLALQENLNRAKFTPATEVKKEEPKPPQAEPKTSAPSPSQPASDYGNNKEQWLRYISTLNTATAILEGVWQPDPMKPQAENIANKIEWVISISAGLRARYEKNGGKA